MASACRDILGKEEDIDLLANTGQDWYDAFKKQAENLRAKHGDDYMKKNKPGSWLPVSYTHLDVYKRQDARSAYRLGHLRALRHRQHRLSGERVPPLTHRRHPGNGGHHRDALRPGTA